MSRELGAYAGEIHVQAVRSLFRSLEAICEGAALAAANGNKVTAARLLGIPRATLRGKMASLGLDVPAVSSVRIS